MQVLSRPSRCDSHLVVRTKAKPCVARLSGGMMRRSTACRAAEDGAVPLQPSRHMALPNNALWLLDYLQDQYYCIRGQTFVIKRAEAAAPGAAPKKHRGPKTLAPLTPQEQLSMIRSAAWQMGPHQMLLEGATVDVSEWMELFSDEEEEQFSGQESVPANTACTGIVMVQQLDEESSSSEDDVFYTNSASPRRTKMVGFTCKCCGARNYNSVNPQSFHEGTLVAQCAKCERWHKLSDHLGLFHDLKGPLFRTPVSVDDVPPSLRILDPFYWQQDQDH